MAKGNTKTRSQEDKQQKQQRNGDDGDVMLEPDRQYTAENERRQRKDDQTYTQFDKQVEGEDRQAIEVSERRSDRSRAFMSYAGDTGENAARAYVRALNEAATSLIPAVVVRPGVVVRAFFDITSQIVDFQRAMWDEILLVGQEDARRATRRRTDDRVDMDRGWEQTRERIGR